MQNLIAANIAPVRVHLSPKIHLVHQRHEEDQKYDVAKRKKTCQVLAEYDKVRWATHALYSIKRDIECMMHDQMLFDQSPNALLRTKPRKRHPTPQPAENYGRRDTRTPDITLRVKVK